MTTEFLPDDASVHYDEQLDTYRVQYDWASAAPLTTVIVEVIATIDDASVDDLEPLYETVDPDAVTSLFDPDGATASAGGVWFHYAGYRVTIRSEGEIEITPSEGTAGAPGTAG